MYGQGHYAPQFGQSPSRPPRPPFMQQQVNRPPASAGQLHSFAPPHGGIQSAGQQQPHAVAQYYPPQASGHSSTMTQPYPTAQQGIQSPQYVSALPPPSHSRVPPPPSYQSQNTYMQQKTVPLSLSELPPAPPMLSLQTSSLQRPATLISHPPPHKPYKNTEMAHSAPSFPPPPPPPFFSPTPQFSVPMSSSKLINSDPFVLSLHDPRSNQAVTTESVQTMVELDRNRGCATNDGSNCETETKVDLPKSPPRPTNEKTLHNIEILCQYISQNGPAFEDMVRQNEAGNPKFEFLFGGESGSEAAIAHEYYLWRKNKICLRQSQSLQKDKHAECKSSMEPNNSKESLHSLSDSDMDMEDDVTQPGEKLAVTDRVGGVNKDFVSAADSMGKLGKDNLLQNSQGTILTTNSGPPIKVGDDDEGRPDKTLVSITRTEDPFSLLKDYASDVSSEDDAGLEVHDAVARTSTRSRMKNFSESKATKVGFSWSPLISAQCKQSNDLDTFLPIKISVTEAISGSSFLEKKVDSSAKNNVRADTSKQTAAHALEERDALNSSGADLVSESSKGQREHAKSVNPVKVDEFGRLIREDVSESDSDDSSCNRRHGRRSRSRSLSRSSLKRRRRSPWRRKERRSLSRSWSPKRRRSRSRSPLRRAIDIGSKKITRGRRQLGECFNYLKGRCYRGASCRFIHNDPDKNHEPRHHRNKYHASETRTNARDYDYFEESKVANRKGSQEYDINGEEMQLDGAKDGELNTTKKQHTNIDYASKGETVVEKDKAEYLVSPVHFGLLDRDCSAAVSDRNNDTIPEGSSAYLLRSSYSKDGSALSTSHVQNNEKSELSLSHGKDEDIGFSQAASSKQVHHAFDFQPQHMRNSCPESSIQISSASSTQPLQDVLSLCKKPVEPMGQKDQANSDPAINYPYHVSQLQLPMRIPLQAPPPPSVHVANQPHAPQPMPNYISVSSEHSVALSSQHTQYHTPQSMSWVPLPTPFPPYIVTPPIHSGPASFQQGNIPVRSDPAMQPSLKTKPNDLPVHPQAGTKQGIYIPMQGSRQPPQHVAAMLPGNPVAQAVASSISTRDDQYVNSFASGHFSSSFSHGIIPPQSVTSFGVTNMNKGQSFSKEVLPSGEPSCSGFQNPPYLQQPYGHHQVAGDGFRDSSHYSADLHRNHISHISDSGSKETGHHNPYASTFDQPINSKFCSDVFRQGQNPNGSYYENSNSSARPAFEGQRVAHVSPMLPKSGGDQYDPLFDSIEPSAESLKKQSEQEDHAADNSDIMFRLSGTEPLDVKINRKKKALGAFATASSSETDGFGETADAEVPPEEAGSLSNLNDGIEGSVGDVEIDQLKRDGKSKKNKDSRSMKLFKVELAGFVKDMLKPSWRQGNMSKEAFKTIVKKTVEKVSGAMKGHRVPKSKEKIDRYIERSQRKLTTLVEGYVNKYARA